MVDAVTPAQFSTINYTKDGEKISATKQGSTVTLVGDKNGTRQMPLDDFVKNELPNAKDIKLEKSPEQDTVQVGATVKQVWDKTSDIIKEEIPETTENKKLDVTV
jgi:hypothetical protein